MTHTIVLVPGDGIGPEVSEAVLRIIKVAGVSVEWEPYDAGSLALERQGTTLPIELLDSIRRNKVALKGPVTTPIGEGFTSVNVGLRKALDLFANLRPGGRPAGGQFPLLETSTWSSCARTPRISTPGSSTKWCPGVVESLKVITDAASSASPQFAFNYARRNGRKRVTAVHKANIMKLGDGLFLQVRARRSRARTRHRLHERIVDAACMQLVMNPQQFDVLVMPNLYGDIVSDLCAGLVGGLGVVPGANIGEDIAVFEAVHGSAPDIAGQEPGEPDGAAPLGPDDVAPHRRARRRGSDHGGAQPGAADGEVRTSPAASTRLSAAILQSAASCWSMWRSIITADMSSAVGFARPLPRDVGRAAVHRFEHRAVFADVRARHHAQAADESGARGRTRCRRRGSGSTQHVELLRVLTICMQRASTMHLVELDVGVACAPPCAQAVEEQPVGELHDVRLVHRGDAACGCCLSRVARRRTRRCGVDAVSVMIFRLSTTPGHDLVLEPGVEIFGVLAHDDHVDVRSAARRPAGSRTGRTFA